MWSSRASTRSITKARGRRPRRFSEASSFRTGARPMPGSKKEMARVVRNLIRENDDVRLTVKALEARGVPRRKAELELGRAFLGGLWEARHGMPDRWPAVLRELRAGKSSAELFPDEPYDGKVLGS